MRGAASRNEPEVAPAVHHLVRVEIMRTCRRPLTPVWVLWFAVTGSAFSQVPLSAWASDVAHMTLVGAYGAAFFGIVPAVVAGLVSGNEDARLETDKERHLAGVSSTHDLIGRIAGTAAAVVAAWLAACVAAFAVSCVAAALGLRQWSGGSVAASMGRTAPADTLWMLRATLLLGLVALPLLAAYSLSVAVLLRSQLRATAVCLGSVAAYWVCVGAAGPRSSAVWLARVTPAGAAFQLATLQTFPGDERFSVDATTAAVIAVLTFGGVIGAALWIAARRSPCETRRSLRQGPSAGRPLVSRGVDDAAWSQAGVQRRRNAVSPAVALTVTCLVLVLVGVTSPTLTRILPDATFDQVYQALVDQTDRDVVLAVSEAIRRGDWEVADAYTAGGDVRRSSPDLVRSIRDTPSARLDFVRQSAGGEELLPGLSVLSESNGALQGPTFLFVMSYSRGRWQIEAILDESRARQER